MKSDRIEKIGNTPVKTIVYKNSTIACKLEQFNLLGSIKSRTAYYLIKDIISVYGNRFHIKVCESTSGNLGLALQYFCSLNNMDFLCLTDRTISSGKLAKIKENSVKYELVDSLTENGYREARINRAKELQNQGYIWTNQYDNNAAILAHFETTGPEIYRQTEGRLTHVVCAMGTGGTIIGIGKYLKSKNPHIQIVGVEPWGSTIFSDYDGGYISAGAGMKGIPGNIFRNLDIIDIHETVKDEISIDCCNELKYCYHLDVGITSGMAFCVSKKIAETIPGSYVMVVCPDGRSSYEEYF